MEMYSSFCEMWWETMPIQVLLGPNLDISESMCYISENPIVNESFVRAHPDVCWISEGLSRNSSLNSNIQNKHTNNFQMYSPISIDTIQQNSRSNFAELSRHPYITWDHVKAFPYAPWDIETLLKNPMSGWKEVWESQQRIQMRTKMILNELVAVTGQTGYYFRNCKAKTELIEEDEFTENDLEYFRIQYPVNFRICS